MQLAVSFGDKQACAWVFRPLKSIGQAAKYRHWRVASGYGWLLVMLPHPFPLIAGATRVAKTSIVMRGKTLRTTWKALEHIVTPQIAQNQGTQEHKKTTATDPEETLTMSTTSSLSLSKSWFLTERSDNCGHTTRQPAAVRSAWCRMLTFRILCWRLSWWRWLCFL